MSGNAYPVALNFGNKAAKKVEMLLARKAQENARRIRCGQCELMILPETMAKHVRHCHEDGE